MCMKGKKGFTLIEIVVVAAILLLLASLLFPVFARVREQGRKTVCAHNLRQIGLALLQYTQDNSETFPPSNSWHRVLPYIRNPEILICPSDAGDFGPDPTPLWKRASGASYSYNDGVTSGVTNFCALPQNSHPPEGVAGLNIAQVKSADRVVLALETSGIYPFAWHESFTPSGNNARSNVCFVDGHVKFIKIYHDDTNFPELTDFSACYDPPGTANQTSNYEYQWSATP